MSEIPSPGGNYEFTEAQNVEFRNASYWMSIMGRVGIVFGVMCCLGILNRRIDLVIQGINFIIMSVWTLNVAAAFRKVAETTGRDIDHVMDAVVSLKKLYRFQAIIVQIAVILVVLLILRLFLTPFMIK